MKEAIVISWVTTLVGAIVILASVASVFFLETTWTEASIGITSGVGLILAKDAGK